MPYSHHPYAYSLSNPVNYTDPSGKCIPEYFEINGVRYQVPGGEPGCEPRVTCFAWQKGCAPLILGGGGGPNWSDAGWRLWHTFENVGYVGAVIGDTINAALDHPTAEAQRIASEDPYAAFLGNAFTSVATAGLPMWGARSTLAEAREIARSVEMVERARRSMVGADIALLSGLGSMGGSVVAQITSNFCADVPRPINWGDAGLAGIIGSLSGSLSPYITSVMQDSGRVSWYGGQLGAGILGSSSNTLQYVLTQASHGESVDRYGLILSSGTGVFGGVLAGNVTLPKYGGYHLEDVFRNANVSASSFMKALGAGLATNLNIPETWKAIENYIAQ